MSRSPKYSTAEQQAAVRRAQEAERARREQERERVRQERERAALEASRAAVSLRARTLLAAAESLDGDRATLGLGALPVTDQVRALAGRTPRTPGEISQVRRELDASESVISEERATLVRTGSGLALARARFLSRAVDTLPDSDRRAHDGAAFRDVETALRALRDAVRSDDLDGAARELRRVEPLVLEHVRRVREGCSALDAARDQLTATATSCRAVLDQLAIDAGTANVPFAAEPSLRRELEAVEGMIASGRIEAAQSAAESLSTRLATAGTALDDTVDHFQAGRALMSSIAGHLPELGLTIVPGSLQEDHEDGSITLTAATASDDGLAVVVTPAGAGHVIEYHSQRIDRAGPGRGACDDVVAVAGPMASLLAGNGFTVSPPWWDDTPDRPTGLAASAQRPGGVADEDEPIAQEIEVNGE